jgi:hypothetical protein
MKQMIRSIFQVTSAVFVIATLVVLPGCGGSQAPPSKTPATESGHSEGDGHDHSKDAGHSVDDGHDHGKEESTNK